MGKVNQARDSGCEIGELEPFFEAIKSKDVAPSAELRRAILQDAREICSMEGLAAQVGAKEAETKRRSGAKAGIERLWLSVVFALSAAAGLGAGYAVAGSVGFVPDIVFGEYESVSDPDMFADVEVMLLGGVSDV